MIGHGAPKAPKRITATPITAVPITIERRREYVSATTPVGTSKTKIETSMNVPTSTSWSGLIPTSVT